MVSFDFSPVSGSQLEAGFFHCFKAPESIFNSNAQYHYPAKKFSQALILCTSQHEYTNPLSQHHFSFPSNLKKVLLKHVEICPTTYENIRFAIINSFTLLQINKQGYENRKFKNR